LALLGIAAVGTFITLALQTRMTGQRVLLILPVLTIAAHLLIADGVRTQCKLIFVLGLSVALGVATCRGTGY